VVFATVNLPGSSVRHRNDHAAGVVLMFQADMWDTSEASLSGFDAPVRQIGTLAGSP
jgi:hypothetical protein